jgi:hypothetical protein
LKSNPDEIPYEKCHYFETTWRTYIQNTHRFRGFKLTFADWVKFIFIEELTYLIDVIFQEKILTNDSLDLIWSPACYDVYVWLGHCFKAITLVYLLLIRRSHHLNSKLLIIYVKYNLIYTLSSFRSAVIPSLPDY